MKRMLCILAIAVLAPFVALLSFSEAYQCVECHPEGIPIIDCLASGCHDTFDNGNHHTTAAAMDGTCTVCHDPNLVADYDENNPSPSGLSSITPTVQSCNNCHKGHSNPVGEMPNQDPYPFPIDNTAPLEHMAGQGYTTNCLLCHTLGLPTDPDAIKQCETCHTVETLHNIAGHAVIAPDPLPYDGYWYDANGDWNLIDNTARCIACHSNGFDPAPDTMLYVSQDVGTYDTGFSGLVTDDCRSCHGLSTAERHHQLLSPVIEKLQRKRREPGQKFNIVGSNFGDGILGDYVRIGATQLAYDHNRIIEWTPTNIKVKIPKQKYVKNGCAWFEGLDEKKVKVWVNVGGVDSNKKRLTLIKNPADCQ